MSDEFDGLLELSDGSDESDELSDGFDESDELSDGFEDSSEGCEDSSDESEDSPDGSELSSSTTDELVDGSVSELLSSSPFTANTAVESAVQKNTADNTTAKILLVNFFSFVLFIIILHSEILCTYYVFFYNIYNKIGSFCLL